MDKARLQGVGNNGDVGLLPNPLLGFLWCPLDENYQHLGGLFASVGHIGMGFNTTSSTENSLKHASSILLGNNMLPEQGLCVGSLPELVEDETWKVEEHGFVQKQKKKKGGLRFKVKVGNASLRKLISGGIAGAVSRTAVAPLETIRTHLMVGTCGNLSSSDVFKDIMQHEGWKGLFRGNLVNVLRVAPSKAIELFVYDTAMKHFKPKPGEEPKMRIPAAPVAGAFAGLCSTLCTYPLELLKTRMTVQRGLYDNLIHAFMKIVREEGPAELYRGLTPSLIGIIPYAGANYFAYDTLRKAYKKFTKKDEIGNLATLLIGSAAGAISCTATFPTEIARKHMQAGAVNGTQYKNMLHALVSILEHEGVPGLYRGLGPSCMKIVPAAGIAFMCYEASKKILVENEEDDE